MEEFSAHIDYEKHMSLEHQCAVCGNVFCTPNEIDDHVNENHTSEEWKAACKKVLKMVEEHASLVPEPKGGATSRR